MKSGHVTSEDVEKSARVYSLPMVELQLYSDGERFLKGLTTSM